MANEKHKVVVLGGGFGGIKTALELAGQDHYSVTLVSDREDFRFYPALYHAATGGSEHASSIPLKEIFADKEIRLVHDTVKVLNRDDKKIECLSGRNYNFDILVVALGVVTNYFGIKGLNKYSYGIKTLDEAQDLRDHLHKTILDERHPELNYVVIGGGPTGVELAGALPGYLKHIMKKHKIPKKPFHVDLVEAESRLMPRMSRHYSVALQKRLRRLGVKLYLNQKVEAETAEGLMLSDHSIKSHTVIWTAGVTNHPFLSANKFNLNERGKALVNELLQAEEDIYVIGDNADTPFSGMAQTALYDAIFIATNLKRLTSGKHPWPYKPHKPVYITPAGRNWAAVQWKNTEIYGLFGWLLRDIADLVAYHDLEPWWKASKHWLAENQTSHICRICDH
ncbi:MAG TPA: FAD-dependent oxidoreductase [Candidatus Saccharimonadales bacterium]|nr:FAD-dependent oxidoreductase [Candidatus Saccharimonadales bacterium]